MVARAAKPPAKKTAAKKPAARAGKYVYFFGAGKADGDRTLRDLLGGKGANLAEMTNAGLPGTSRDDDHHRGLQSVVREGAPVDARRSSRRWKPTCASWKSSRR